MSADESRSNPELKFTYHAQKRLLERSTESIQSIQSIISENRFLRIGSEERSTREHFLIYSTLDQLWHVLVVDSQTSEVITILPIDYHSQTAWEISSASLEHSYNLSISRPQENRSKNIRISVIYYIKFKSLKRANLGPWPLPSGRSLSTFIPTSEFWQHIKEKLKAKRVPPHCVECIHLKCNKNSSELKLTDWPL